jgi:anthranilate synthase component I
MAVAVELELTPSLGEVRELASRAQAPGGARRTAMQSWLVPLRHTFIADCETPVSAYLKLRGDGPSFLLESAEQGQQVGRWSFLGCRPRAVIRLERGQHPDPYRQVDEELARYRIAPLEGLPPFAGGAVGMFGYDLARSAEPTIGEPNPDETGMPELAVMVTDVLLAFDHLRHEVTVLANVVLGRHRSGAGQARPLSHDDNVERAYGEAAAAIADVRERLRGPVPQAGRGRREPPEYTSNMGPRGYAQAVERAKEYIRAGDVYQVVPSQRWSADCPVDAFSIYRGLRAINPSPYMYFLDFEDFEIAGASPETLVTVAGRTVRQRPIAGTRPRADSVERDLEQARELLADPKERAEHVMLVDLGRNDLGRVCEYGSVKVDELMAVETYSHVMHIVSQVSGTLSDGVTPVDALRAALPVGTLSGAPKIRAMQIIDELEPAGRGPYGGGVGYLSYTGDLDTCIYIRSALVKDGRVHIQAGGGIVADSEPGYELRETEAKAGAVMDAIRLACSQGDWS